MILQPRMIGGVEFVSMLRVDSYVPVDLTAVRGDLAVALERRGPKTCGTAKSEVAPNMKARDAGVRPGGRKRGCRETTESSL